MSATVDRAHVIRELREVFDRVTDGRIDTGTIHEQSHIRDDLALTSLEMLELRFELESLWQVKLEDQEAQQLSTVQEVVDLIVVRAA